jgi:predicted kinase
MIGLPGSGKSHFARLLAERWPAVILDSDALRGVLFNNPAHTQREHRQLFPAMHELIDGLLSRGISVIIDATNLKEEHRKPYDSIAKRHDARIVLVRTWAPKSVIEERLRSRERTSDGPGRSTATLEVYERMRKDVERISLKHTSINTALPLGPALDNALKQLQS